MNMNNAEVSSVDDLISLIRIFGLRMCWLPHLTPRDFKTRKQKKVDEGRICLD